jgi:hypothetical protein
MIEHQANILAWAVHRFQLKALYVRVAVIITYGNSRVVPLAQIRDVERVRRVVVMRAIGKAQSAEQKKQVFHNQYIEFIFLTKILGFWSWFFAHSAGREYFFLPFEWREKR